MKLLLRLIQLLKNPLPKRSGGLSNSNERITILIAHRLSTIMHADCIYVLERGKIVETGTHKQLLTNKSLYYAMWRQQAGERKLQAMNSETL
jgi:ATP-binding cassette subfamily B protein